MEMDICNVCGNLITDLGNQPAMQISGNIIISETGTAIPASFNPGGLNTSMPAIQQQAALEVLQAAPIGASASIMMTIQPNTGNDICDTCRGLINTYLNNILATNVNIQIGG